MPSAWMSTRSSWATSTSCPACSPSRRSSLPGWAWRPTTGASHHSAAAATTCQAAWPCSSESGSQSGHPVRDSVPMAEPIPSRTSVPSSADRVVGRRNARASARPIAAAAEETCATCEVHGSTAMSGHSATVGTSHPPWDARRPWRSLTASMAMNSVSPTRGRSWACACDHGCGPCCTTDPSPVAATSPANTQRSGWHLDDPPRSQRRHDKRKGGRHVGGLAQEPVREPLAVGAVRMGHHRANPDTKRVDLHAAPCIARGGSRGCPGRLRRSRGQPGRWTDTA